MADLADDGFRLLDHLGIDSAHVCGVSMGGMIVQTMACTHPQRVRSLTSIMSTLGKRTVGWQDPKLLPMLLAPRHAGREAYVETSTRMWKLIGSPDYPEDPESVRERAGETFDRGVARAACCARCWRSSPSPTAPASSTALRLPALVIHGDSDRMVHVSGGRATAQAIPGAELILVKGMGHDIPAEHYETIADGIRRTADRARSPERQGDSDPAR